MNHQRRFIYFLAGMLLFGSAACSNTSPQSQAESSVVVPLQSQTTTEAQPSATPAVASTGPTESLQSSPSEGTLDQGLSNLDSYTSTTKMTLDGAKEDGSPVHQEITITQKLNRSQNASDFSMNAVENQNPAEVFEVIQINGDSYMLSSDTTSGCMYFGSEDQSAAQNGMDLTPEELLGAFENSQLIARGEQVNGVSADHYKVSSGFVFGGAGSMSGETWIDPDGGFIVRYTGQADVNNASGLASGEVISGKATWEYDLTDINSLGEIQVPEACQHTASTISDVPIPENAQGQSSFGNYISFTSPDPLSAVANYYDQQLAAQGWQVSDDLNSSEIISISASKDDRTISVMITPGQDNDTSVFITISQ